MAAMAETAPLLRPGARCGLDDLTEASVRHGFVQKVYGIVAAQLLLTVAIGAVIMKAGEKLRHNEGVTMTLTFMSLTVSLGLMCVFTCKPNLRREFPTNYILLALFTVTEAVMVGFVSLQYTEESLFMALGISAVAVVAMSVFACQTRWDFRGVGPYVFCAFAILSVSGLLVGMAYLLGLAGPAALHVHRLLMSACGALVFSVYLIFDTQLIIGGKHGERFEVDDYAMAAICLYLDIVQIFQCVLEVFGNRK